MKFKKYLKDKKIFIIIYFIVIILNALMLLAFKNKVEVVLITELSFLIIGFIILIIDFFRKKEFYDELQENLENLDKKYLIQEIINKPDFYDGEILYDILYEIDKSMLEDINEYKNNINDFIEYIEMWIHEVKIPISSLVLMNHNEKEENRKYAAQIKKLDDYIDQVLYYVRSKNAEKDFIIREFELNKIISNVLLKNKDDLLKQDIDINVQVNNIKILTDSKWLEFIINQIINNSIKYKKDENSNILIKAYKENNETILIIKDNGVGIPKNDIPRVFEKTFTGENGRVKAQSTGIGLYIVKKLCNKLGHKIEITSVQNEFTQIKLIFEQSDYYKMNQ